MGLLFKSFTDSLLVSGVFYTLLLLGGASGLRHIPDTSFSYLSVLLTIITFNFSILNIRVK
ncbi:Uncharacterised protein [uncultured archaeon]|nr:Uncharacterised protein [uncultured archaeon]